MVEEPLTQPGDLNDFPGAPFPERIIRAAEESVRDEAEWHIAPVVTETVRIDAEGGAYLRLPSLRVVEVTSVTIGGVAVVDYELGAAPMLYRRRGWPYGVVEVTLTHGYPTVPAGLLPVIAARCQRARVDATVTQRSETVGARTSSEAYNINRLEIEASASGVDRYKLPPRF
jgi:membrane protein YdbS with pleckstrin-like domain